MIDVTVLGTGCPKCKRLEQIAREAIEASGTEARLQYVTNMQKIMEYPILSTPGLVVDEELKCSGRLPRKEEVISWLEVAQKGQ